MKYIELLYAFELEAANLDKALTEKISTQDILYWLNLGVNKFVKTRYNGSNAKGTAFEQDEKRSRDLMCLHTTRKVEPTSFKEAGCVVYLVEYPDNLFVVLDESVEITDTLTPTKKLLTSVFECTADSYMYRITNTLTDFHWRNNRARPLRVRTEAGCNLYTDGNYIVTQYTVNYLRTPATITLEDPFKEYVDFPEHVHGEIVKLSVLAYLESTSSNRYLTIDNEINTME